MKIFVLVEDWKQHSDPHCIGVFTSFKSLYAIMKREIKENCPDEKLLRKKFKETGHIVYTRAFTNHRISIWQRDTKRSFTSVG